MLIKNRPSAEHWNPAMCRLAIRPNEGNGIRIELDSVVKTIFGDEIIRTVQEVLNEFEVRDADISLVGQGGARLRDTSRMQAVILRASGEQYDWSKEDALWKTA